MLRNYTRWVHGDDGRLCADILMTGLDIHVDLVAAVVDLDGRLLSPDEARLIGVRLIEAATLADRERAIRVSASQDTASA